MAEEVPAEQVIIIPERLKDVKAFFDKESETSDAILRVEGESLYVNKAVIALASKELASLFTHPDGATTGKMEATLEEKKYSDVLDMMTFIYPNFAVAIDETNVESLTTLAYEYKIKVLQQKCTAVMGRILANHGTDSYIKQNEIERVLRYVKLTDIFSIADLREECITIICAQFYKRNQNVNWYGYGTQKGFGLTSAFETLPESLQQELILNRLTYMERKHQHYSSGI